MCNFIIRPIKSYVTIDTTAVVSYSNGNATTTILKAGTGVVPICIDSGEVVRFEANGYDNVSVPLSVFIHAFTADSADINRVKEKEAKWFKPQKESK